MTRRGRWGLAILSLLAVVLPAGAGAGEPVRIRVGWVVVPNQFTPIMFEKKEIVKGRGRAWKTTWKGT